MPNIVVSKNPFKHSTRELHQPCGSVNLLDWMNEYYTDPLDCGVSVCLNGKVIADTDVHGVEFSDRADIECGPLDTIQIIHRPHGLDPLTIGLIAGAAILSAVAVTLLAPRPEIPNQSGQTQTSPNNRAQAARNEFRPRQAISEIYGRIRAYPDFIQRPYYEWDGVKKIFTEVLRVGVGDIEISNVRAGDTSIPSEQVTVRGTGGISWPATLRDVRGVEEARDTVIPAREDSSRFAAVSNGTLNINGDNVIDVSDDQIIGELGLQVGDDIRVTGEYFDLNTSTTNSVDFTGEIVAISGSEITLTAVPEQSTQGSWNGAIESDDVSIETDWFVLPHPNATELRYQIEFSDGLTSGDGPLTITLSYRYQEVDADGEPIGSEQTQLENYTRNSPLPQGVTEKIEVPEGRYRIKVRNISSFSRDPSARQTVRLAEAESSIEYSTAGFGDITGVMISSVSSPSQRAATGDRINCIAERRLPIFDPDTATFGASAKTRSGAQAVMHQLVTRGNVPLSHIDYEALFEIEESLSSEELGYFDFSFDDANVSLRERVITACNAARVHVFYIGPAWNFTREEPKANRSAMFNRRNTAPESSRQSYRFTRDGDPDGVTVSWIDPDSNAERYEYRRWDGSQVVSEQGIRPVTESLAGCRNQTQAADRADWEMNKLVNQRRKVQTTVLSDGMYVGLGERVGWVDMNDADVFDGEIVGINGNEYDTTERFEPKTGVDYFVYITDDEGRTSASVACQPRPDTKFGFIASGLSGAYTASGLQQLGSRYVIASNDDLQASDFIVVSRGRPDASGNVPLELANAID